MIKQRQNRREASGQIKRVLKNLRIGKVKLIEDGRRILDFVPKESYHNDVCGEDKTEKTSATLLDAKGESMVYVPADTYIRYSDGGCTSREGNSVRQSLINMGEEALNVKYVIVYGGSEIKDNTVVVSCSENHISHGRVVEKNSSTPKLYVLDNLKRDELELVTLGELERIFGRKRFSPHPFCNKLNELVGKPVFVRFPPGEAIYTDQWSSLHSDEHKYDTSDRGEAGILREVDSDTLTLSPYFDLSKAIFLSEKKYGKDSRVTYFDRTWFNNRSIPILMALKGAMGVKGYEGIVRKKDEIISAEKCYRVEDFVQLVLESDCSHLVAGKGVGKSRKRC